MVSRIYSLFRTSVVFGAISLMSVSFLVSVAHAQETPGTAVTNPATGRTYQIRTVLDLGWDASRVAAVALTRKGANGHLATITSNAENSFLLNSFGFSVLEGLHLGGRQGAGQPAPMAGWEWITGEPWSFLQWADGKPDDLDPSGVERGNANRLAFGPGGKWIDKADSGGNGYLVEFEYPAYPTRSGYQFLYRVGAADSTEIHLSKPRGIAEGPDGTLYVMEESTDRVSTFDASGNFKGVIITGLAAAECIVYHPDGHLYLTEHWGHRITKYRPDGTYVGVVASTSNPTGLAVKPNGNLAVVEFYNNQIKEFTTSGILVRTWSVSGRPWAVTCDGNGVLYCSEYFPGDGSYVNVFADDGQLLRRFKAPYAFSGLALDSSGKLLAASGWFPSGGGFYRMTTTGVLEAVVENGGTGDDQLLEPTHLFVISHNRIAISDHNNNRVVFWTLVDDAAPSSSATLSPSSPASGWHLADVVVSIDSTDDRAVQEVHHSVDMGTEVVTPGASASLAISTEGIHSVAYWAVDNAGNVETTKYATVKIDKTAPATSAALAANTVTFSASDGLSGVASTYYRVGSGGATAYTGPFVAPRGMRVTYWSVDIAGNVEGSKFIDISASPTQPRQITVIPNPIDRNATATGTIVLNQTAPPGGTWFDLAANAPGMTFPSRVTIPAGQNSVSFRIGAGSTARSYTLAAKGPSGKATGTVTVR